MKLDESRIIDLAVRQGMLPPEVAAQGCSLEELALQGRLTRAQLLSLAEGDPSLAATLAEAPGPSGSGEPLQHFEHWDKYEVLGFHAEGGMGRIYRARDRKLGRWVALKFIARASEAAAQRFAQEAQAQARVEHEAVCRVYEVGEWQGEPYIAMQFIEGPPLQECLGKMALEEKVDLLRRVAEGLHAAHRLGLIHRDVKTGNILVERGEDGSWRPYVVDFGLARAQEAPTMTQTGLIVGTPAYMSPEQARGDTLHVDRRSDVYSLGATLYEAITGKLPFNAKSSLDIMVAILGEDPPPPRSLVPSLPADLEAITLKCLEKDPARRYESAAAVAEDLRRFLDGEPVKARQIGRLRRLERKVRRHPVASALVAASALVSLLAGGWGLWTTWKAREQAAIAQRFGQEVEQMDAILRFAHLLPLHDVSREKHIVRDRMALLAGDMGRLGRFARGPGHAALGRGHLALREWPEAARELERAWNLRQRDRGTAQALGLALANLYQRVLEDARKIRDPGQRTRRKQAISTELRDKALAYLQAGKATVTDTAFIQGIIALQEERFDDALARAREAQTGDPWKYESTALEGEIHYARATALSERGDYEGAIAAASASEGAYGRVLAVGRSDDSLRIGMARALLQVATVRVEQGRSTDDPFLKGMELLRAARQADSRRPDSYQLEARLHWQRATDLGNSGRDAREALRASIQAGETALNLGSQDIRTYDGLATAYWYLSQQETSHGKDGERPLAAANVILERGKRVDPTDPFIFRNLGVIHGIRAELCFRNGTDPGHDLATSVANFRKAIELDPGYTQAHFNLGNSLTLVALKKSGMGQDPREEIEQAEATLAKAIELNPGSADFWDQRGVVRNLAATYKFHGGKDPLPDIELALAHFTAALQRNPQMPQAMVHRAEALQVRTLAIRGSGKNAWRSLEETLEACEDARKIDRDYAEIASAYIDALCLKAVMNYAERRPVAPVLAEARKALSTALARDRSSPALLERQALVELTGVRHAAAGSITAAEQALAKAKAQGSPTPFALNLAARLSIQKAQDQMKRGNDPGQELESGMESLEASLKRNPRQAEALALKGQIELLRSKSARDPGRRKELVRSAQELLKKALSLNPFLGPEWKPAGEEAVRLASS